MVQRRKEALRGLLLYVGRGFAPPGRLDLRTLSPDPADFGKAPKSVAAAG